MTEVNIRELKSRLSYYLKLMQTGEVIAIKDREKPIGFLTQEDHRKKETTIPHEKRDQKKLKQALERLKAAGLIKSSELPKKRIITFNPGKPNPNVMFDSTDIIRKMRDEEEIE